MAAAQAFTAAAGYTLFAGPSAARYATDSTNTRGYMTVLARVGRPAGPMSCAMLILKN
jgi:hypothetical protein